MVLSTKSTAASVCFWRGLDPHREQSPGRSTHSATTARCALGSPVTNTPLLCRSFFLQPQFTHECGGVGSGQESQGCMARVLSPPGATPVGDPGPMGPSCLCTQAGIPGHRGWPCGCTGRTCRASARPALPMSNALEPTPGLGLLPPWDGY